MFLAGAHTDGVVHTALFIFFPLGPLPNKVSDCRPEWVCIVIESKCNELSDQSTIEYLPLWYSTLWLLPFSRQLWEILDWNVCADAKSVTSLLAGFSTLTGYKEMEKKIKQAHKTLVYFPEALGGKMLSFLFEPSEAWELVSNVKTPHA